MRTEGVRPEVPKRLEELSEASQAGDTRSMQERIADFIANCDPDVWTARTARRIFEEDAEFFRMLGDR